MSNIPTKEDKQAAFITKLEKVFNLPRETVIKIILEKYDKYSYAKEAEITSYVLKRNSEMLAELEARIGVEQKELSYRERYMKPTLIPCPLCGGHTYGTFDVRHKPIWMCAESEHHYLWSRTNKTMEKRGLKPLTLAEWEASWASKQGVINEDAKAVSAEGVS